MNKISEALLAVAQKISGIQSAHWGQPGNYDITREILEQVAKEIDGYREELDEGDERDNIDAIVSRLVDLRYIELKHTVTRIEEAYERGYWKAAEGWEPI